MAGRAHRDQPVQWPRHRQATAGWQRGPTSTLWAGVGIAVGATAVAAFAFAAVAVANDAALRDTPIEDSRFGPVVGSGQPPLCDEGLDTGSSARLDLRLDATVDLRPIGDVGLLGTRVGDDFRWLAYVAGDRELGQYGEARIGPVGWATSPGSSWSRVDLSTVAADTVDRRILDVALTPEIRSTAEDRGVEVIEGARARRCRVSIDGNAFHAAFPEASWLIGDADLHRWRGQLDYWIFMDGELGQVAGSANGEAAGIVPEALSGTIDVRLTATERGRDAVIYPPSP